MFDQMCWKSNVSRPGWATTALLSIMACTAGGGCARSLTISQDEYVNTAMHVDRKAEDRTGEPLELNVVLVYPKDLKDERNDRLKPSAGITSAEWFKKRPIPGDKVDMEASNDRFRLPPDQILLLTNDSDTYGRRIGSCIRGARLDGKTIAKKAIDFSSLAWHDDNAVIYVFARFVDKQGQVLEAPPARFHPPGAYSKDLAVKIGTRENASNYGQYIEIDAQLCPRKMHGAE